MSASTERPPSAAAPRRPARPALSASDLIGERYRLVHPVDVPDTDDAPYALWLAQDEVLARPVAIRLLPAGGRAGRTAAAPFMAAAAEVARLAHPHLARVYDADIVPLPSARSGRPTDVAFVVSEWVTGQTLADLVAAEGPLDARRATALGLQAAEALDALHSAGLAHRRLHPGNVLITAQERVTVTDAAVAAALHDGAHGGLDPYAVRADTVDLGAVLYGLLTARWPSVVSEQPSRGIPAAPRATAGSAVYAPRQVRAGIPRSLDGLVLRVLEPRRAPGQPVLDSPAAVVRALSDVDLGPVEALPAATVARRDREPSRLRRFAPALGALLLLLVVAVSFRAIGEQVGQLPRRAGAIDELVDASPGPSAGAGAPIDLAKRPVVVRDFDPGGTEQPGSVPNAYDGDSSTAWMTDGYASASFGGLKKGVGLLVDLGRPTVLGSVKVGVTLAGADVELRTANAPGRTADGYSVVARATGVRQVATLVPSTATPTRYWLVWFTRLPKADDGRYRAGVAELVFTRGQ